MGNNPISGTDPDGGWDWFINKSTGELAEAPGKGKDYVGQLGLHWEWFAKDGKFSVHDKFVYSAGYNFDHHGWTERKWTSADSEELMSANGYEAMPTDYFELKWDQSNVYNVPTAGYSHSFTTSTSEQVWQRWSYFEKGSEQVSGVGKSDLINIHFPEMLLKLNITTYHRTGLDYKMPSKAGTFMYYATEVLNRFFLGSSSYGNKPKVYRGFDQYPALGSMWDEF